MAKSRCKLRTKMWGPPNQRQRAFNGQVPDGEGGYIRKRDKLPPNPLSAAVLPQTVARITETAAETFVVCAACCQLSPDEGQRCCPKCKCPQWRGERLIENYPTQEGVVGCASAERSFLEKIVREG